MNHGHVHRPGHGHVHDVAHVSDTALLWAIGLNVGLSVFEVAAGLISGSVALLGDALHNFNDCAALLIAYVARRISRRGADEQFTFSYRRAELIGAMINLTALMVVALLLLGEALHRLFAPEPLDGGWMMAAAGVAVVIDVLTAWLLWAMARGSLNVRAAFAHNLTDALASVAVLLGGAAVFFLDWKWVDPVLTFAIAGYILLLSAGMLRRTARILMEAAPAGLDLQRLRTAVQELDDVVDLHHIHVWELDEQHRALEAHVVIPDDAAPRMAGIIARIQQLLADEFAIAHATLQLERVSDRCAGDPGELVPDHR